MDWTEYINPGWDEHRVRLETGINMAYLTLGPDDGEPVVMIHGASDNRISWCQIAPIVARRGFRVFVPELRGHGKSDKPAAGSGGYTVEMHTQDMISFLKRAGRVHIVGHSLGSMVAQRLAAENPEQVKTLTLIGSGADFADSNGLDWFMEGDGETFFGIHGYDDTRELPDDFIREWTATTNEDEAFREAFYLSAKELPYEVWSYIFEGAKDFDNNAGLADITAPMQIIWGTEDTFFPAVAQEKLKAGLINAAGVKWIEFPGATHDVLWDSLDLARQTAELIAEFAAEG